MHSTSNGLLLLSTVLVYICRRVIPNILSLFVRSNWLKVLVAQLHESTCITIAFLTDSGNENKDKDNNQKNIQR